MEVQDGKNAFIETINPLACLPRSSIYPSSRYNEPSSDKGHQISLLNIVGRLYSMDGMFMEFGPFQVNQDKLLELNPHSWARNAHLLFGMYQVC